MIRSVTHIISFLIPDFTPSTFLFLFSTFYFTYIFQINSYSLAKNELKRRHIV